MSTDSSSFANLSLEDILSRVSEAAYSRNDTELATALRTARSTLSTWKARGTIPYEELVKFAIEKNLSLQWLLFGDGGALRVREEHISSEDVAAGLSYSKSGVGSIGVPVAGQTYTINPEDYVWVPFYDIEFGAGGGRLVNFEKPPKEFNAYRKNFLQGLGLLGADLFEATAIGTSMEPVIRDESTIMINASDKLIRSGEIYGVQIGDEFICKYVRHLPGGKIEISSENTKGNGPIIVNQEELNNGFSIVGRVVPLPRY